jgi:hypothetical protein
MPKQVPFIKCLLQVLTILPLLLLKVVYFEAMVANVVTKMLFFMIVSFITVWIYLYYHDGHFDVITKMTAFLGRNYYCTNCDKGYDHKGKHFCYNVCHHCFKIHNSLAINSCSNLPNLIEFHLGCPSNRALAVTMAQAQHKSSLLRICIIGRKKNFTEKPRTYVNLLIIM